MSKHTVNRMKSTAGLEDEEEIKVDPKIERENEMVAVRTGLGEMSEKVLDDFGFSVNRLHDPCNYDHTTIDQMLSTYKFRDLGNSKLFRLAQKIFGDKMDAKFKLRKRTFNLTGIKQGSPGGLSSFLYHQVLLS